MRRTNPDSELNIKRIDSQKKKKSGGGTHGFQVYFRRGNVEYTRLYSDGINGGKEAARLEARNFRSILEQAIPPSRAGAARTGPARSNTGYMGISITSDALLSGEKTLYVEASVRIEKGKPKNRQFRVGERPLTEVIQEALAWRNQLLEERLRREAEESASDTAV
ncbi:MAG: hypothetical protein EPN14_10530 [Gallionella sp.]|nr:MAG: hypothetical protein EPN14_10530 [Gallionella sp.]